jgi:gamma-glutamyltranspeptidase / glutathione hydrolase
VLQVIMNTIDFAEPVAEAVAAPRVHHQWMPDQVMVEPGLPPATSEELRRRGHDVMIGAVSGAANSIAVTPAGLVGAADTRVRGGLAAGY